MNQAKQPDGSDWQQLVGAFLINFGAVELVLFNWIEKFSTDIIVRDIAIDLPLSKRLALVCDLIKRSDLPDDRKKRALELWGEVAKVSATRNIIAHSPFITHTESGQSGFIDIKKLKGIRGPIPVLPISFMDIASAGKRIAELLPEIIKPF